MQTSPGRRPEKMLQLYEGEFCPYCRKVRNALTMLDLDAEIYPVPKKGQRFRAFVEEHGGTVPVLVDPNVDRVIPESADIIEHLFATYGTTSPPARLRSTAVASLPTAFRGRRGMFVRPSRQPEQLLELYNTESSPYCRLVREVLCELEIPYIVHNVPKGGLVDFLVHPYREKLGLNEPTTENRRRLYERGGRFQIPFLIDPNTGTELFESRAIVNYLLDTYGTSTT
ncbi:MAG: glutathione S-transferase [Candidatus Dadabacteria bacterium]|nr:MAG: glutathione S-transferase [Candidatus Dadabacteria bacterium]